MLHRQTRFLLGLLAAALLVPGPAVAQTIIFGEDARRAWLGISYLPERVRADGSVRQVVRITEVVEASPAERAGLLVGDTIVSVNEIPASDQLLASLTYSLDPGESVRLRIRRQGREQDITVAMAERPAAARGRMPQVYSIDPDSIRALTRILLDSARFHVDTLQWGRRFPVDTLQWGRMIPFPGTLPDSLRELLRERIHVDTLGTARTRVFTLRGDTLLRAEMDSVVRRLTVEGMRGFPFDADSARWRVFRELPAAFEGTTFFAIRAVAGAELADVDPAMETYFGASDGVLVLRVGEGTPAARAGLRPGDVIVGVDDRPVADTAEFRRLVAQAGRGQAIRLEIMRERRALRLELGRE